MTSFRRLYGSSPLHLLANLGLFFVTGWSIDQILGSHKIVNWIVWFLGAALLHDLVLLPAYSALDRGLRRLGRAGRGRAGPSSRAPDAALINHLRVPAAVAGILLLVYFPVILGYSSRNYRADSGHALSGDTRNWLLICAGLFLASALLAAGRAAVRRAARR
jgi:hypothetical protein